MGNLNRMAATHQVSTETRFDRRRKRTRLALIEAAIECFSENGTRATTLEQICDVADVSPRTFFNHFETRDHLYAAIARYRTAEFTDLLAAHADDERPVEQRLPELFGAVGMAMAARPAYRELVGEMLGAAMVEASPIARGTALAEATAEWVRSGVGRGQITHNHRPEVLADLMLGALLTAITNWSADEDFDLEGELVSAGRALASLFAPPS